MTNKAVGANGFGYLVLVSATFTNEALMALTLKGRLHLNVVGSTGHHLLPLHTADPAGGKHHN